MYINIHSHFSAVNDEWVLQNFYKDFDKELPPLFSAGLHPWYLQNDPENDLEKLKQLAARPGLLAIGECGLDKVCSTEFTLQQSAFEQQVLLANTSNKPLIIHCVKAHQEVLAILARLNNQVPVVFHGFNRSKELALQITGKGHYVSFGKDIQKTAVQEYLSMLPLSQLCFETDDAAIPIETVYQLAASALNISVDGLSLQVKKNTEKILAIQL